MEKFHFPAARHPELKNLALAHLPVGRVRGTDKEGGGWQEAHGRVPEVRLSEGSDSGRPESGFQEQGRSRGCLSPEAKQTTVVTAGRFIFLCFHWLSCEVSRGRAAPSVQPGEQGRSGSARGRTGPEVLDSEPAIQETQEERLAASASLATLGKDPACLRPPRGSMW